VVGVRNEGIDSSLDERKIHVKILHSNKYGSLSIKELQVFEQHIGISLPDDYRDYLLTHNGGKPENDTFHISEGEGESCLHHVYGLHDGPNYFNLRNAYEVYYGRIPSDLFPIADDVSGNKICIGLRSEKRGKIYFWDHELEAEEGEEPYWSNITEIAPSFSRFVDLLYKWIDPNETEKERIIRTNDIQGLRHLVGSGIDMGLVNQYGRTLIEEAAIKGNNEMIQFLFENGAKLGKALIYAQNNAEFFQDHQKTVTIISRLMKKTEGIRELHGGNRSTKT
jgi:hypothetical protein